MEATEQMWGLAQRSARQFLRRFDDPLTRRERDDLVQECAITAWRWAGAAKQPNALVAAVRTIARRARYRLLACEHRQRRLLQTAMQRHEQPSDQSITVNGQPVATARLLRHLEHAMSRIPALDRQLLLGNHEGFCVAELAERFGIAPHLAKARLYRARRRLRREIEATLARDEDFEAQPKPLGHGLAPQRAGRGGA